MKGATASASYKPATLETGLQVMVPQFVEAGIRIKIDTRDNSYLERGNPEISSSGGYSGYAD